MSNQLFKMVQIRRLRGQWIGNKGIWRVPMTHYRALLDALASVPGVRLTVEPLPAVAHGLVQVTVHICW